MNETLFGEVDKKGEVAKLCDEAEQHLIDNCDRSVLNNPEVDTAVVSRVSRLLNDAEIIATGGGDSDYDYNTKSDLRSKNHQGKIFYLDVQRLIGSRKAFFFQCLDGKIPQDSLQPDGH